MPASGVRSEPLLEHTACTHVSHKPAQHKQRQKASLLSLWRASHQKSLQVTAALQAPGAEGLPDFSWEAAFRHGAAFRAFPGCGGTVGFPPAAHLMEQGKGSLVPPGQQGHRQWPLLPQSFITLPTLIPSSQTPPRRNLAEVLLHRQGL